MKKFSSVAMLVALVASPVVSAYEGEMIEIGSAGQSSNQVFILKHADPSKGAAFVRVGDSERLSTLMEKEGYEVVAKEGPNGPEPVVGEIVPEELARNEAEVLAQSGDSAPHDAIDIGLGINIGITTGGKARFLATLDSGFVVGVDVEVGTVLFLSDVTASALFGWSFEAGKHIIRPYMTIGGGFGYAWAVLAAAHGPMAHGGVGVEWKPARWFGLGLEGGVNMMVNPTTEGASTDAGDPFVTPYLRLTLMFYFR